MPVLSHTRRWARSALATALVVVASGCTNSLLQGPGELGPGRRILFIGNSLTYVNDLPGIVQAMADSAGGDRLAVATVAFPDFALVDHWKQGTARSYIAAGGWEFVVLQQGPSSLQVNRDSLRLLTSLFAGEISRIGGRTALYSVWPTIDRQQDFQRAIESYQLAATDVNGVVLPVASAWLAAWQRDAAIALYSADGLHPSAAGSYLAALVIYRVLLDQSPVGLPPRLRLRSGEIISIPAELAATLQQVAAELPL